MNLFNPNTKIAKALLEDHYVVSCITHVMGHGTTTALASVVSSKVYVIAPKIQHSFLQELNPDILLVTPQYYLNHPETKETILWMHAGTLNGMSTSILLKRRT